ncbi:MAG: ABC transporter ATP-binding protein [Phycisphaerae bacterium]|nr:ABC transporter ATP-binding protein [Phycisphaerae bacterium]
MSDELVLRTSDLTKVYGNFTALDGLSISLERGRILGFIGPNGAGKTTTIKILVGLVRATRGEASICGAVCGRDTAKIKRLVGYMPDVFGSYDNMRVFEYLDFFGAAFGIPRRDRKRRIDECLELTGATRMKDLFVESLSHGMKQRVALTRTMLHEPQMLILDEPANGLDPHARVEMREVLLELARRGTSLIVTSHILPELARICDTVAIITGGKLRAFGTLDQIMRTVRHSRVMEVVLGDGAAVAAASQVLAGELGGTSALMPSREAAEIRFTTDRDDAGLAAILGKLVAAGVRVVQFREIPMDLEDAFLSVTGQTGAKPTDAQSGAKPAPDHVPSAVGVGA